MPQGAVSVHSRDDLAAFLSRDPGLHLYELGDLDPFFFPDTIWFASRPAPELGRVVLLYGATELPVLLALSRQEDPELGALIRSLVPLLPPRLYAHLAPGLVESFRPFYRAEPHGRHDRMILENPERMGKPEEKASRGPAAGAEDLRPRSDEDEPAEDLHQRSDEGEVQVLGRSDLEPLLEFYGRAYPGNWFDPRMLETGCYLGIRGPDGLQAAAGVHVYSPTFGVAALGNIAVDPGLRGRGLGRRVTAALCRRLLVSVRTIGLNVKSDNAAAIACYTRLGFVRLASYEEYMLQS